MTLREPSCTGIPTTAHAETADGWTTMLDVVRHHAAARPNEIAYTYLGDGQTEDGHLTFGQLEREAQAIAVMLRDYAEPGDRVVLVHRNHLHFVKAFFGALFAGLVAVPACAGETLMYMSRNFSIMLTARPRAMLATESFLEEIRANQDGAPSADIELLDTEDVDGSLAEQWESPEIGGDTLAFLQFTSGSTNEPKGVMVSHGNILANQRMIQRAFGHSPSSVVVGWLPLFHDMGLIGHVLQPAYTGCRSILLSPSSFLQRPLRWLQAVSNYRATTTGGPNFAYDRCLRRVKPKQRKKLDLSSLAVAYNGSEPVRRTTLRRFAEFFEPAGFNKQAFFPCFGLAEATLFVSGVDRASEPRTLLVKSSELARDRVVFAASDEQDDTQSVVSCGVPQPEGDIAIVEPEQRRRLADEQIGEIWVRGPHVAGGYFQWPEETQETFGAYLDTGEGPFLRTGDLGFIKDAELYVTGRLKDLIIVYGRNYYPHDIEQSASEAHPGLRLDGGCAFPISVDDEERVVIVQAVETRALRDDLRPLVETIREAVAEHHQLAVYGVCLVKSGDIPKTSSGKVQRRLCRSMYLSGELQPVFHWTLKNGPN